MPNSWAISSRAYRLRPRDVCTLAVALDPIQQGREAHTCLDRVRTGYRRIIELIDDLEVRFVSVDCRENRQRQGAGVGRTL